MYTSLITSLASLLSPVQSAPEIATDDRFGEMLRFFFIALIIVGPLCWILWRRQARKYAPKPTNDNEAESPVAAEPDPLEVSTLIATIDRAARALAAGESTSVEVPTGLTLNGAPAPRELLDALIEDAIARNRVTASWSGAHDKRIVTLAR